jgi:hypothetical protein
MVQRTETVTYVFRFGDGQQQAIDVVLTQPALDMVPPAVAALPAWTELTFHQCPNCPLDKAGHTHCPIARNLVSINDAFRERISYETVNVEVRTAARQYVKECPLQEAVSALMGLVMATSGCPHLDRLRPMVFTHLPFATAEQTTYRAVSMYLLAQFFRQRRGMAPDWALTHLTAAYTEIRLVNGALARRLAHIQEQDANLNAIVKLDCQADITSSSISEQWWEDLEQVFRPYLEEPDA